MRLSTLNIYTARALLLIFALQALSFERVSFARDEIDQGTDENTDAPVVSESTGPSTGNTENTDGVAESPEPTAAGDMQINAATEELSSVAATPPPSDLRPDEQPQDVAQALMQAVDHPETLTVEHVQNLAIRALTLGHRRKLEQYIESVLQRISLPADNMRYRVELVMDRQANASVTLDDTRTIRMSIGLLKLVKNEDELAYVLAHEITHANPNQATVLGNFTKIEQAVSTGTQNHPVSEGSQREELRADLGAMERLIRGGYNPWAGYNFLQSIGKAEGGELVASAADAIMNSHPAHELRMLVMKAYFLQESQTRNLSEQTANTRPFPALVNWLRPRVSAFDKLILAHKVGKGVARISGFLGVLSTLAGGIMLTVPWALLKFAAWVTRLYTEHKYELHLLFDYTASQIREALHNPLVGGPLSAVLLARMAFGAVQIGEDSVFTSSEVRERARNVLRKVRELIVKNATNRRTRVRDYAGLANEIENFTAGSRTIEKNTFSTKERAHLNGIQFSRFLVSKATDFLINGLERTLEGASNQTLAESAVWMNRIFDNLSMNEVSVKQRARLDALAARIKGSLPADNEWRIDEIVSWLKDSDALRGVETAEKYRDGLRILKELGNGHHRGDWSEISAGFLRRNYSIIAEAVFNRENPDLKSVDLFRRMHHNYLREDNDSGLSELYNLRKSHEGADWLDRLTIMSHTVAIPISSKAQKHAIGALMDGLNRKDTQQIMEFFESQFHSVAELDHFITHEAIPRRMNLRTLEPAFYVLIDRHPEWIRDVGDVTALVRQDHFWPNSSDSRVRAFEQTGSFEGTSRSIGLYSLDNDFLGKVVSQKQEYDLALSERLHLRVRESLQRLGGWPKPENLNQSRKLWQLLVKRGVTPVTDELIFATHRAQPVSRQQILEDDALGPPRMIWDEAAHARLVEQIFQRRPEFQELASGTLPLDSAQRRLRIQQLMNYLNTQMPDRGVHYQRILEALSRQIRTSERESALIMNWKRLQQTRTQQDRYARYFSGLISHALRWNNQDQWELVKFLRGEDVSSRVVNDAFARIGPGRVRQAYAGLPIEARTAFLDSLLDGKNGMLHMADNDRNTHKRVEAHTHNIVNYLLQDSDASARAVAGELMESFLHSLSATGNAPLRSSTLSYLLAQPAGTTDSGDVLKRILENFGTAGVKIGQFLVASGTLPVEITRALRSLQDKAREPARSDIYSDLREILDVPAGVELPYVIGDLLGAASVKYAVSATERSTGRRVVLKVLRQEAIAHTEQEFKQLNAMAEFLEVRHGSRYGVFRSIIRASYEAIQRELNLSNEVRRGEVAGRIYNHRDRGNVSFHVPTERLVTPRLIEAEFIPGKSINDLEPAHKVEAARAISETEWQNFHQPDVSTGELVFCPDRHPGNYRIQVDSPAEAGQAGQAKIHVGVIDFGQLVEGMPLSRRKNILEIFAHAQALKAVGNNRWVAQQVGQTLGLSKNQVAKLRKKLGGYFPARNAEPVGAYFSLLAALEDSGAPQPIDFYDYVRGVIQTHPYQEMATTEGDTSHDELRTAERTLEAEVRSRAKRIERDIELTPVEKASYAWREFTRWYRGEATVSLEGDAAHAPGSEGGTLTAGAACRPERLLEVMQRVVGSSNR